MSKPLYLIVATDEKNGIGKDGRLPWHFPRELAYFREITTTTHDSTKINAVIMGRKTWESIPEKFRPLPARKNIVVTTNPHYEAPDAEVVHSLDEAYERAENDENIEQIFVIGGAALFETALHHPFLIGIYRTEIHHIYDCDTFFGPIPTIFSDAMHIGKDHENRVELDYWLYRLQTPRN